MPTNNYIYSATVPSDQTGIYMPLIQRNIQAQAGAAEQTAKKRGNKKVSQTFKKAKNQAKKSSNKTPKQIEESNAKKQNDQFNINVNGVTVNPFDVVQKQFSPDNQFTQVSEDQQNERRPTGLKLVDLSNSIPDNAWYSFLKEPLRNLGYDRFHNRDLLTAGERVVLPALMSAAGGTSLSAGKEATEEMLKGLGKYLLAGKFIDNSTVPFTGNTVSQIASHYLPISAEGANEAIMLFGPGALRKPAQKFLDSKFGQALKPLDYSNLGIAAGSGLEENAAEASKLMESPIKTRVSTSLNKSGRPQTHLEVFDSLDPKFENKVQEGPFELYEGDAKLEAPYIRLTKQNFPSPVIVVSHLPENTTYTEEGQELLNTFADRLAEKLYRDYSRDPSRGHPYPLSSYSYTIQNQKALEAISKAFEQRMRADFSDANPGKEFPVNLTQRIVDYKKGSPYTDSFGNEVIPNVPIYGTQGNLPPILENGLLKKGIYNGTIYSEGSTIPNELAMKLQLMGYPKKTIAENFLIEYQSNPNRVPFRLNLEELNSLGNKNAGWRYQTGMHSGKSNLHFGLDWRNPSDVLPNYMRFLEHGRAEEGKAILDRGLSKHPLGAKNNEESFSFSLKSNPLAIRQLAEGIAQQRLWLPPFAMLRRGPLNSYGEIGVYDIKGFKQRNPLLYKRIVDNDPSGRKSLVFTERPIQGDFLPAIEIRSKYMSPNDKPIGEIVPKSRQQTVDEANQSIEKSMTKRKYRTTTNNGDEILRTAKEVYEDPTSIYRDYVYRDQYGNTHQVPFDLLMDKLRIQYDHRTGYKGFTPTNIFGISQVGYKKGGKLIKRIKY